MINIRSVYALCFVKDMGVRVEVQGVRFDRGSGNIQLTGNVGELARDSVVVTKTLLRSIDTKVLNYDYHLHFQYLSLQKDGPSWGLACFILLCLLAEIPLQTYCSESIVAATGELDLSGRIKPVKYLREKVNGMIPYVDCKNIVIPTTEEIISIDNKNIFQISNIKELLI